MNKEITDALKIAIIGSGPSGFYAAKALTSLLETPSLRVDIFDRLTTPYGLLHGGGVAPDHQNIKRLKKASLVN